MLESSSSGSVRGVFSNEHPYREPRWDCVEKVGLEVIARWRGSAAAVALVIGAMPHVAWIGSGIGISMASLRRFWAAAARC